jgi:hypothetical protein
MPNAVRLKLINMFGAAKTEQLARELMHETGVASLDHPDHLLRFGDALVRRGGVLAAIGRSVRVQAFLAGASGNE